MTWITLSGIADLDTVAEGGTYTEKSWSDNEETASFTKKGNYIGITLEAIDRDNVGAIKQLPRKLGLAAARTLSGLVSALFTDNRKQVFPEFVQRLFQVIGFAVVVGTDHYLSRLVRVVFCYNRISDDYFISDRFSIFSFCRSYQFKF